MAAETAENSVVETFLRIPVRWELRNMFKNLWNQDEPRVFPPTYFGFGWDFNLYALVKRFGLVGSNNEEKEEKDVADEKAPDKSDEL